MFNKKNVIAVLTILLLLLQLPACDNSAPDATAPENVTSTPSLSPSPDAQRRDETLYNSLFGIEILIPADWHVELLNEKNLSGDPALTTDVNEMDVVIYADGGVGMELLEIWSREDTADPEHASFNAFVEAFEGADLEGYTEAMADAFSGDFGGYVSVLESSETVTLGGNEFVRLRYNTETPDREYTYIEEYYVTEVDTSTFAVFCVNYWEDNEVSHQAAMDIMNNINLS